jgi:hypothetical protein
MGRWGEEKVLRLIATCYHYGIPSPIIAFESRPVITTVDDPDFGSKIQTAIRQQMTEHQS